jgi:uncharacterized protein YjaZ
LELFLTVFISQILVQVLTHFKNKYKVIVKKLKAKKETKILEIKLYESLKYLENKSTDQLDKMYKIKGKYNLK